MRYARDDAKSKKTKLLTGEGSPNTRRSIPKMVHRESINKFPETQIKDRNKSSGFGT